ncbi:hypothetical protein PHSY_004621 [Pseudozyma hubeiensis SY62]|uniref:Uncharacterized protein n=1 Tax=Pseudozyma hubeiensis (strain SY62) TaxID=1305764 RepID=R9P711_PSEHS|nr:hypothetical protein PHSY_004621 [Pseudozyma hubeiensis SY62]GAC97037.1 hypothetical protein PHSY_004621 [Pseudozyma hubeiensis SY62]
MHSAAFGMVDDGHACISVTLRPDPISDSMCSSIRNRSTSDGRKLICGSDLPDTPALVPPRGHFTPLRTASSAAFLHTVYADA